MTLLYFITGRNLAYHYQANFAILSWLARGAEDDRIVMLTDAPEFYRFIDDERVVLQELKPGQFEGWKGPHQFYWRAKIMAIAEAAARYPGTHIVYQDGDTFCFSDPARLRTLLDEGRNLMHAREGALAELPTKSERQMWRDCQGNTFGGVTITADHQMWNAGVVGISADLVDSVVPKALEICDDMLAAKVTQRLIEQFSLSVALGLDQPVLPANGTIGHYWGNKEGWDPLISEFFLRHHLRGSTYAEQVEELKTFDFHQIPIYTKSSGTHRKLSGVVDKLFTKNVVAYAARSADGPELSERLLAKKVTD